jgi:hypothetical protein
VHNTVLKSLNASEYKYIGISVDYILVGIQIALNIKKLLGTNFVRGGYIMTQMELRMETCLSCADLGYCLVRWGPECKRQGGTKIPRMKSMADDKKRTVEKQVSKHINKKTKIDIFEPIRTRVANW